MKILTQLRYLLIVICFLIIFYKFKNQEEFFLILSNIDTYYFYFTILFFLITNILSSYLIFISFKLYKKLKLNFSKWNLIFFDSQILEIVPFLGLSYRAIILKKKNIDFSEFFYVYLFIFLFSITVTCFFLTFESFIFLNENYQILNIPIYVFFLTIGLLLFFLVIFLKKFKKFFFNIKLFFNYFLIDKIYLKYIGFCGFFSLIEKNLIFKKKIFTCILFIHICDFVIFYNLLNFFNLNVSFDLLIAFFIIFIGLNIFYISPKNIGISELVFGYLFTKHGLSFEVGVLVNICYRLYFILSIIILFLFFNLFFNNEKK